MNVEQFKEIADETLGDLIVDERLVARIRQGTCGVKIAPKRRVFRMASLIAAACAVVMLVSGGMLAFGNGAFTPWLAGRAPASSTAAPKGINALAGVKADLPDASVLSAQTETSKYKDGTTLSYGIESIGDYTEGFAVAKATNGLYGYVNDQGTWVVRAIYDEAQAVSSGEAQVVAQGVVQVISVKE